jgi:hypothetical protein
MNWLLIGFFSIFLFGITEAWGEDWKLYGENESGVFYYDAGSITRPTKDIVRVWAKMVHSKESIKQAGKGLENLVYSKRLWEINCIDKTIRRISKVAYSKDDKILISDNKEEKFQNIKPKSLEQDLYEKVCK